MGFFDSRWVPRPAHVTETEALPDGFRFAAAACGLRGADSSEPDLGLLVCDAPDAVSAMRFADSGVLAAPVLVSRECTPGAVRAVLANAGNANAATGENGIKQALRTRAGAASALAIDESSVALASTGVIGVQLAGERILAALPALAGSLERDGDERFAAAIRTTDVLPKHARLSVELPSGTVRLAAQCKGAGMISPRFATMLCFVQTDAVLDPQTADLLLGVCCKRSFDRISVDGQLSTNDTALLIASGRSGVRVTAQTDEELRFGEALDALLRRLALRIVADGEGARRIGRVHVRGGDAARCERVARAIGNSPLVKAALYGGDANWGRIAQAIGAALPGTAPLAYDIAIEGVSVCRAGAVVEFDRDELTSAVTGDEVSYEVWLAGEGAECELFFSDLSYDYVRINAEYTT
jgi:glutamate N-acetyltransferase/amino-acid N-acetyltransferase